MSEQATVYEGAGSISAADLLQACRSQVANAIADLSLTYDPGVYVNRAIESRLAQFLDGPAVDTSANWYLLLSATGSGKTNLCCYLAQQRAERQPVVLLMGGSVYIGRTTGLLGGIQYVLEATSPNVSFRSAADSLEALHALAEVMDQDVLVILDAMNEYARPAQMGKAVRDLLQGIEGRRVRLLVTCRDDHWELFEADLRDRTASDLVGGDEREDEREVAGLGRFSLSEYQQALPVYLNRYGMRGQPLEEVSEYGRDPLRLRAFCEAYRGQDISTVADVRLQGLWDRCWERKLDYIVHEALEQADGRSREEWMAKVDGYLLDVAASMFQQGTRAVPLAEMPQAEDGEPGADEGDGESRSVYERIRDQSVLVEEKIQERGRRFTPQAAFAQEAFMEYVMARTLMRDWDSAELDRKDIVAKVRGLIRRVGAFPVIYGVMVYLAALLKEGRDIALWPLLLEQDERWQKATFETIRELPRSQVDAGVFDVLVEMLSTEDERTTLRALETVGVQHLAQVAPTSVVGVVSRLAAHECESICRRAIQVLGRVGATDLAVPTLIHCMGDPRESVGDLAKAVLLSLDPDQTVDPLIAALQDENPRVRSGAAAALGVLGAHARDVTFRARLAEPLVDALEESDTAVRSSTVEALAALGGISALPLVSALRHGGEDLQQGASEALVRLGAPAVSPLVTILEAGDEQASDKEAELAHLAAQILGRLGEPAQSYFAAGLQADDWYVRRRTAATLARLGKQVDDSEARAWVVRLLAIALEDRKWQVRREAAEALWKVGDVRAVKHLIDSLADENLAVQREAAEGLGELSDERAVQPLVKAFMHGYGGVESKAAEALVRLGDPAVEPLIAVLESEDSPLRRLGLRALKALGLWWMAEPRLTMQERAAETLLSIGTPDARAAVRAYEVRMRRR